MGSQGGSGGSSAVSAGSGGSGGADPTGFVFSRCPAEQDVGNFQVQMIQTAINVTGRVEDAVTPASVQEVTAEQGDCQLLRGRILFCEPECGAGEVCDDEGACQPAPETQDVGTVTIEGFDTPVELRRSAGSGTYNSVGAIAPVAVGTPLRLMATGGVYPAFTLQGVAVGEMQGTEGLTVSTDQALEVTWDPPETASEARVQINLNINNHGTTPAQIQCEAADDGSFEIPEPLISALAGLGLSGFPTVNLTRQTVEAVQIEPGCIEMRVLSQQALSVEVEGIMSCNADLPCPEGMTCDPMLLACTGG